MKKLKVLVSLALAFCTGFLFSAQAQEKNVAAPTGLALKVTYFKTAPTAYLSVLPKESSEAWFARFGTVSGWQLPAGRLPVRAVNVVSQLENENSVKVIVSVFTGQKFHEKEEPVATFTLRENENRVVDELKQFGVEPFEIGLMRVAPSAADLPAILNKTNSLTIVSVEPNFSTLPSFRIRIQNLSNKNVKAMATEIRVGEQMMLSGMPQGRESKALIYAGEVYELKMSSAKKSVKTADGYKPELRENQTFVIRSAIFEDGSFEGDAEMAARFRGFMLGRKLQLKKIIALFDKALENQTPLRWLETEMAKLTVQADEASLKNLIEEFPDLSEEKKNNLRISVEVSMQGVKKDTSDELASFQKAEQSTDLQAQTAWLKAMKERYEKWLSSLS